MAKLGRRMQILLDEGRHSRLERESVASGRSVAALIRAAIDKAYPDDRDGRARAAADFLREARSNPLPVEDWPRSKREIRDEMAGLRSHDAV